MHPVDDSQTVHSVAQPFTMRSPVFVTKRRRWPGLLAAGLIAAALTALAVSSYYDQRTVGARLDAGVNATETAVQTQVAALKDSVKGSVNSASQGVAQASGQLATTLADSGITASVKSALAADPALSMLLIKVDTKDGVVRLDGPAPDENSRRRAEVLAAAPAGVTAVDNRLVIAAASTAPAPAK